MARKTDWLDYAHTLDREREAIADKLPSGVECSLSLHCHGSGPSFGVRLSHSASRCSGYGSGRTPAKALEDAMDKLQEAYREWSRRPRLVEAKPKPLADRKEA